jgi:putative flippase GtrA
VRKIFFLLVLMKYFLQNEKIIFLAIGFVNTIFSFVVNYSLYILFQSFIDYKIIVLLSTVISLTFNFFSYNICLYKKFDNLLSRILKFFISGLILIMLSMIVFIIFYGYLNFSYLITILISISISVIYSYSINKTVVFKTIDF